MSSHALTDKSGQLEAAFSGFLLDAPHFAEPGIEPHYAPDSGFVLKHTDLHLTIDPVGKTRSGEAVLHIAPLPSGLGEVTFDLDDLGTGTATSGADYTAIDASAQISVADGATTGTLTVEVTEDALVEATETVIAQISNSSFDSVTINTASATANITNDDTATADLSVTTPVADPHLTPPTNRE